MPEMGLETGSVWRRWDLHVHTPESHTATYGPPEDAWERFISELEALPDELTVVGINDYMWVDGYERVLQYQENGRLQNLEAIFPVVELRLDDFVGTTGKLSRLNAHALFAPGTDPDLIRGQFIAALTASFKLTSEYSALQGRWSALATKDSLADLGRLIKAGVPVEELANFQNDFIEGFNNWVIPLQAVITAARGNTSFSETPLIALGKTEWADIPWGDNTIAAKKNIISEADLLFTAAEDAEACNKAVAQLVESRVNHRLLDCSDAHHFADSSDKDRIGNVSTWICADPTLAGLKHALLEYENRIFHGQKPDLLARTEADPTSYFANLRVGPLDPNERPEPGFDLSLDLNPGFCAVIGNKGSGKSALLDTLALLSNSDMEDDFSFLSKERYRNPRNPVAESYGAVLTTADGTSSGTVSLGAHVKADEPPRIRYLPQSLLERLCNETPGAPNTRFEAELRSIIFSHVPKHERAGAGSLDDLLDRRTSGIRSDIDKTRRQLASVNAEIVALEDQLTPRRRSQLETAFAAQREKLIQHEAAQPPQPVPPEGVGHTDEGAALQGSLDAARIELAQIESDEARAREEYEAERGRLDLLVSLRREIEVFEADARSAVARLSAKAEDAGLDTETLITLEIDLTVLDARRSQAQARVDELGAELADGGPLSSKRSMIEASMAATEAQLDEPRREYESKRRVLEQWREVRQGIVGDANQEGSLEFYKSQIEALELIPDRLQHLTEERIELSKQIHGMLTEIVGLYRELYQPVQDFISDNPLAEEQLSLEFAAEIEFGPFQDRLLGFIDRGTGGSFYGVEQSEARVRGYVDASQPDDWSSVRTFLEEIAADLASDRRGGAGTGQSDVDARAALRMGVERSQLYDFVFGLDYLETRFALRSDGKPIRELSPGQKGTLLLMFYLIVDRSTMPIALDQPDENLDNHTVHTLLRPALRMARSRRQVLVVTHSPNLAVVGDADQVVVARLVDGMFSYDSGSIENPLIRDQVVEVLEGTWPAFDDRQNKYTATAPSADRHR